MTRQINDRMMMTSTSTGTGNFVVGAALTGYQDFAAWSFSVGDFFDYVIYEVDGSGNPTGDWETGTGTITSTSPYTFSRALQDSPSGSPVDFAAGDKHVAVTASGATLDALGQWPALFTTDAATTVDTTHNGKLLQIDYEGAKTLTLPVSNGDFNSGYVLMVRNASDAGDITVGAGVGTLTGPTTIAPGASAFLKQTSTSGWLNIPLGGSGGGASAAEDVTVTPAGNITSTNVQAALEELDGLIDASGAVAPVQRMWGVLASATASAFVAGGAGMTVASTVGATRWDITFNVAFASANDYAVVFGGVDDGAAYGTIPMIASRNTTGFQIVTHKNDPASEASISKLSFEVISTRTEIVGATAVPATECIIVALGDETTAITTGTAKVTIRMPYAFTLTAVKASLTTASSSGTPTVDINEGGTTILSTKLTIDASELTSATAATPAVISDSALSADAEITFDIDTAGTGAKGLKVYLIGHQ